MRLNKKGARKVGEFMCEFAAAANSRYPKKLVPIQYEPDDFEGVVVLTTEEAKKILSFFDAVTLCDFPFWLSDEDEIFWEKLAKRIEQAEMSIQST